MAKKAKPARRNPWVSAMVARHPRGQAMSGRGRKRAKDARRDWRREWD